MSFEGVYTQAQEMGFIARIGEWGPRPRTKERKLAMLRGYIAALDHRASWFPRADVQALRRCAEQRLACLAGERP